MSIELRKVTWRNEKGILMERTDVMQPHPVTGSASPRVGFHLASHFRQIDETPPTPASVATPLQKRRSDAWRHYP